MRLIVHVEGETEEQFVAEVLRDYLVERGYHTVSCRLIGNARQRANRGGIRNWPSFERDVARHLSQDSGCIHTMIVDYYGLPASGSGAWPGRTNTAGTSLQKAERVEKAISERVASERFVPYVAMHEFEGLLFSDCEALARGIGRPDLVLALRAIRNGFETPEESTIPPRRRLRNGCLR